MTASGTLLLGAFVGTMAIAVAAIALAAPLGMGLALWTRWLCPPLLRGHARMVLITIGEVPPACLAIGLLLLPVDGWAWSVGLTVLGVALVAVPTVAARAFEALDGVPPEEVLQTISLGATPSQAVATVVVPAARTGLLYAGVLGGARAVGETVVVLLLLEGMAGLPSTLSRTLVVGALSSSVDSTATILAVASCLAIFGAALWVLGHGRVVRS